MHGMGHSNDRFYWQKWAELLNAALSRAGLGLPEEQFGGVYYYDLVPGSRAGAGLCDLGVQITALRQQALQEISLSRFSFIEGLKPVKKLADYVVDNFGDIISYLYLNKTHHAVNARLYEAIDNTSKQVHLIGYSLGAIVCYCALKQNEEAAKKVSHLIMLGSPLFWFKHGVAEWTDFRIRPAVGRFTNIAGILDIAFPHMVPKFIDNLDEHVELTIDFDPIKSHSGYFTNERMLNLIAAEIKKGWA